MAARFSAVRGPTRVVFHTGAARELGPELDTAGLARVLVVGTPGRIGTLEEIGVSLGSRSVGVLAIAREHVPLELAERARAEARRMGADAVLACGGGSAIGLGKAVALEGIARLVAVPTTYSGSEMTPLWGMTGAGEKRTGRDDRVRPALVVYDPALTLALPRDVTVASLWNAVAHAVEALWAPDADPLALAAAEEAVRLVAEGLPPLLGDLGSPSLRASLLEAAYLAGVAIAGTRAGIHHRLCHLLGGIFGLPHAATHAALLPHVVSFERGFAPGAMKRLSRALGGSDAVESLFALHVRTGAPRGLASLGMPEGGIDRVVREFLARPDAGLLGPRPATPESLLELLGRAFVG